MLGICGGASNGKWALLSSVHDVRLGGNVLAAIYRQGSTTSHPLEDQMSPEADPNTTNEMP